MMLAASIALGLLPSLAWLALFLREDVHPEPNRLVLRAFVAGALSTIPVIILEGLAACAIAGCGVPGEAGGFGPFLPDLPFTVQRILFMFFGVAFIEEMMKFLFVKRFVLGNADFDEPVDALLYLVIGALGFAAVENVLFVTNPQIQEVGLSGPGGVLAILGARFLSATVLHALASGIIGYALARTLFKEHARKSGILGGIALATLLHGLYNELVGNINLVALDLTLPVLFAAVLGLLAITGFMLWLMLQQLRAESRIHTWQHSGKTITLIH